MCISCSEIESVEYDEDEANFFLELSDGHINIGTLEIAKALFNELRDKIQEVEGKL